MKIVLRVIIFISCFVMGVVSNLALDHFMKPDIEYINPLISSNAPTLTVKQLMDNEEFYKNKVIKVSGFYRSDCFHDVDLLFDDNRQEHLTLSYQQKIGVASPISDLINDSNIDLVNNLCEPKIKLEIIGIFKINYYSRTDYENSRPVTMHYGYINLLKIDNVIPPKEDSVTD